MPTTSCERCEDFAADARKVLSQRCAPDERHCSCVPHLRAEIERLTAELEEARLTLAAEQGRVEGAPSEGWQAPTRTRTSWRKEGPGWLIDVSKRYDLWDWDYWVLGIAAGAPTATGTAQTARAAMLAADASE